jgi:hypothetical protein
MNGYPVYVLNNFSNVSTNNPFPVSLTSGTNSIGAVSILQDGTLVTKTNPLPVVLNSNAITVTGSVTIPATVTVASSSNDPVHVHLEQALPTGSNHIGKVTISAPIPLPVSFTLPTASNIIGSVYIQTSNTTTIPVTIQTGSNYIGSVGISSPIPLPVSFTLPTASNIIGSVYIQTSNTTTIPVTIQTGSNYIGSVGISSPIPLPVNFTLPTASNIIGSVYIQTSNTTTIPVTIQTGSNYIGSVGISSPIPLPVSFTLPTASNIIGSVYIQTSNTTTIPVTLQTGSNYIGSVNILTNNAAITSNNPLQVQLVANTAINPASNTLGSVNILTNYSNITNQNPVITQPSSMLLDAFGRNRVSDCYTLGDYKHIYVIDPNFVNSSNAGGSIQFIKNKACCTISTSTSNESYAIHQTRMYHHYMPGKSHLILSSICFGAWQSNVTKRSGYFDDYDGIYFEQGGSNGKLSFNILSSLNGLTSISQNNWNIDTLNGSGPSGIQIDITKTQLVFIDMQWLGVGRVRCGFAINGLHINCHEFYNANKLSTVYISNPSLPIRCMSSNIGPSSTGGSMDQICSTVISEGGYAENGIDYAINSAYITINQNTSYPVLSIRLANTFNGYLNRVIVRITNIEVISTSQPVSYTVVKVDSTSNLSGGTWTNVDTTSAVQYLTGTGISVSGSLTNIIAAGVIAAGGNGVNNVGSSSSSSGSSARRNFIAQNMNSTDSQGYIIYLYKFNTNW